MCSDATIRAAAEHIDGKLYIRANHVCRLFNVNNSYRSAWEQYGKVDPLRIQVPKSKADARGVRVYYPLDQVLAIAAKRRSRRDMRWTAAERQRALELVGLMTIGEVARRMRRTPDAIRGLLTAEGIWIRAALQQRHGLITTSCLASIVGRSSPAIRMWATHRGCPSRPMASGRGDHLFDLREVRQWLATRWSIVVELDPEVRRRLGLRLEDGRVVLEQPASVMGGAA